MEQARQLRDFDKKFSRYLLTQGELTLGDMIIVLERSQRSVIPTDCAFARQAPALSDEKLKQLKQIRDWRAEAVHGSGRFDLPLVQLVASDCRAILDAIHSRSVQ
jgi:hypothetical protein